MPVQDLFGLPDGSDLQQWFTYTGQPQPWTKPRGIRMVSFFLLANGCGGGGGFTGATSTERCGGGGGGGGSVSTLIIPAVFLPDIIYVSPGAGGTGGAAGQNGTQGSGTFISVVPGISATGMAGIISAAAGTVGQAGTASAGGASGVAGGASTLGTVGLNNLLCALGVANSATGGNGAAGGANAAGGTLNNSAYLGFSCGGTGGGGCTSANADFAGGQIFLNGTWPGINTATPGGVAGGGRGVDGYAQLRSMLALYGGTGGGSNAAGVGGAGGNGAFGCGGGGGGGGITGGAGGNGGNGRVVVSCWLRGVTEEVFLVKFAPQNVTDRLLATSGLLCDGELAESCRAQLPDEFVSRDLSDSPVNSGDPAGRSTSMATYCFAPTGTAASAASEEVCVVFRELMSLPAVRYVHVSTGQRPPLSSDVTPVRRPRVPAQVLQAVVRRVWVWMVTALHAGWAWAIECFQYQVMNKLSYFNTVLRQHYLKIAFLVRLRLQKQFGMPVVVPVHSRQALYLTPGRGFVQSFVSWNSGPALYGHVSGYHMLVT